MAAFWREDGHVLGTPELAHYIEGWPKGGEVGVVAQAGEPIGAAWLSFFTADDPGYGFVDATVPELSMGVDRSWRRLGVGHALLGALVATAHRAGVPAVSLSVELDNGAQRLYSGVGFVPVRYDGGSVTMTLEL